MPFRRKSWPCEHRHNKNEMFHNKSCDHLPKAGPVAPTRHFSGGIYDKVFELTMNELLLIQTEYNWLPNGVEFWTANDLRRMTWAGRLLVEGWDENDSSRISPNIAANQQRMQRDTVY